MKIKFVEDIRYTYIYDAYILKKFLLWSYWSHKGYVCTCPNATFNQLMAVYDEKFAPPVYREAQTIVGDVE